MWFRLVKELLHPLNYILRHTLKTGMLKPVPASVSSERILHQTVFGDVFRQEQQIA
jgi:hypothetical protein